LPSPMPTLPDTPTLLPQRPRAKRARRGPDQEAHSCAQQAQAIVENEAENHTSPAYIAKRARHVSSDLVSTSADISTSSGPSSLNGMVLGREVCTLKERHARLSSSGALEGLSFLNGEWRRSSEEPEVDSKPHFVKQHDSGMLHLYYHWPATAWQIATQLRAPANKVLAQAISDADHPNTIAKSSWCLLGPLDMLMSCSTFDMSVDGPNTIDKPFLIEELGRDFFIRQQPRKLVIWFECPQSGQVYHSGAKKAGTHKAGNRYCPMCHRCFSANNFKSQHLKSHARALDSAIASPPSSGPGTPNFDSIDGVSGDVKPSLFALEEGLMPFDASTPKFPLAVGEPVLIGEPVTVGAAVTAPVSMAEAQSQQPQPPALLYNISFDPIQEVLHTFPNML